MTRLTREMLSPGVVIRTKRAYGIFTMGGSKLVIGEGESIMILQCIKNDALLLCGSELKYMPLWWIRDNCIKLWGWNHIQYLMFISNDSRGPQPTIAGWSVTLYLLTGMVIIWALVLWYCSLCCVVFFIWHCQWHGKEFQMTESIRLLKTLSMRLGMEIVQNVTQATLNTLTTGATVAFGQVFRAINVVTNCEFTFKIHPGKTNIKPGSMLMAGKPEYPLRIVGTIISFRTLYKNREEATEFLVLDKNKVFSILLWETDRNTLWHVVRVLWQSPIG